MSGSSTVCTARGAADASAPLSLVDAAVVDDCWRGGSRGGAPDLSCGETTGPESRLGATDRASRGIPAGGESCWGTTGRGAACSRTACISSGAFVASPTVPPTRSRPLVATPADCVSAGGGAARLGTESSPFARARRAARSSSRVMTMVPERPASRAIRKRSPRERPSRSPSLGRR